MVLPIEGVGMSCLWLKTVADIAKNRKAIVSRAVNIQKVNFGTMFEISKQYFDILNF